MQSNEALEIWAFHDQRSNQVMILGQSHAGGQGWDLQGAHECCELGVGTQASAQKNQPGAVVELVALLLRCGV
jgi:hypothetical protein